jgi:hypothetical protein
MNCRRFRVSLETDPGGVARAVHEKQEEYVDHISYCSHCRQDFMVRLAHLAETDDEFSRILEELAHLERDPRKLGLSKLREYLYWLILQWGDSTARVILNTLDDPRIKRVFKRMIMRIRNEPDL